MPTPYTRRALLAAGSAAVVGLAGCITGGGPADGSAPVTTRASDVTTTPSSDLVRPEGDQYTVERTVEDEDLTYLPSRDAVGRVTGWRTVTSGNGSGSTREPVYETTPFGEWALFKCERVMLDAVLNAVRERLDGGGAGLGAGLDAVSPDEDAADDTSDGEDRNVRLSVLYETVLGRDGSVVSEPSVAFDRVVAVAPARISVTVTLGDGSYTCTEPVFVRRTTLQRQ